MERPVVQTYNKPKYIDDYPLGPSFTSGHLTEISSGMRTYKPIIDNEKCVKCLRCFLVCPDGTIDKSGDVLEIDYDFCKGCGICAKECKFNAITMHKEGEI
jgi:pyruvate ferredoxin oxidoreductase delta subunit